MYNSTAGGTAAGEFVTMVGELGKVKETIEGTHPFVKAEQEARDAATAQVIPSQKRRQLLQDLYNNKCSQQ